MYSSESRCPLCRVRVGDASDLVVTSHFLRDPTDPFFPLSEAAMHYPCFQAWPHRAAFVSRYNAVMGPRIWPDGTHYVMQPDGRISLVPAVPGP
jgi:hypothetical protein